MTPKLATAALEQRSAGILRAAAACFAARGYESTTLDGIAREAGLSKGGVYAHFQSKREIFARLVEQTLSGIDLISPVRGMGDNGDQRLAALLDAVRRFAAQPEFDEFAPLLSEIWARNRNDTEINAIVVDEYERLHTRLVDWLEDAVAAGAFRPLDTPRVARLLVAFFDGLLVQSMLASEPLDWHGLLETLSDLLLPGLLSSEP